MAEPEPEKLDSLRAFGIIQDNGRVSIPKEWRTDMKWEDGDQIMLERYKDQVLIENLTSKWSNRE